MNETFNKLVSILINFQYIPLDVLFFAQNVISGCTHYDGTGAKCFQKINAIKIVRSASSAFGAEYDLKTSKELVEFCVNNDELIRQLYNVQYQIVKM